jgi:hypothetical protein
MGEDLDSQIQTSMVSMTQLLDPFQLESTLEHLAFGGTMNTVKRCTSRGMPQPIRKFEYVNQTENSIDSLLILTLPWNYLSGSHSCSSICPQWYILVWI